MRLRMLKYGVVGLLGTLLHFALLYVLADAFRMEPVLASAIGFVIVLFVSYALNKYWTFQSSETGIGSFVKYTVVSVAGLLLNIGVMYTAVHILQWHYLIGQSLVILVVPCSNFIFNYYWTFRQQRRTDS
ncbi:GtrA family protein [Paenibacillus thalictri]|uniref:GtrA family protein n=1 Tax=Paenibacillus thalictri TaxID=2527873 RepID=A0A4Q9DDN0_9BACL|nr:GtrA family protein [Paenibacillus thalictri]TBL69298.1 GtrA family protein [Paenibacillus thalictri]